MLNLLITNRGTRAEAKLVLSRSDMELPYDKLTDYYSLCFQIEFNFREAKQYWSLDKFMNVSPTAVNNAANLSLFMVDVFQVLMYAYANRIRVLVSRI